MTTEELTKEYDAASRSPKTGLLYMPSLKWGGWIVTSWGVRHSFGSPLYNTKGKAFQRAKIDASNLNATVHIFSRRQAGCVHAATITD